MKAPANAWDRQEAEWRAVTLRARELLQKDRLRAEPDETWVEHLADTLTPRVAGWLLDSLEAASAQATTREEKISVKRGAAELFYACHLRRNLDRAERQECRAVIQRAAAELETDPTRAAAPRIDAQLAERRAAELESVNAL